MAIDGHRPASHPVLRRSELHDVTDELVIDIDLALLERDPPLPIVSHANGELIDLVALHVAQLRRPLTVSQARRCGVIADELLRLRRKSP